MVVIGMVTQSEASENGEYWNLSIEGFSVIPSDDLDEKPPEGETIRGSVSTYWRDGQRPLHFLRRWSAVS